MWLLIHAEIKVNPYMLVKDTPRNKPLPELMLTKFHDNINMVIGPQRVNSGFCKERLAVELYNPW